ncbi:MAG: YaaC family protein [Bacillaceae bacterium]|nr:YaaC family protein [Bacillaceae bacterium]
MLKEKISVFVNQLKAVSVIQSYLKRCYALQGEKEPDSLSFSNAERFLYYLNHSQIFYDQVRNSPIEIQPILLFYGMVQQIKSCLLTIRPHYPESTNLLAHGASTRKRKKQQYSFLQDEVKIQQKGLFPYLARYMFHMKHMPKDKFSMDLLFKKIPEMNEVYNIHHSDSAQINIGHYLDPIFLMPESVLDDLHLTKNSLEHKLNQCLCHFDSLKQKGDSLVLSFTEPLQPFYSDIMTLHLQEEHYYFPCQRTIFFPFHEIMVHYLLLYNLSMICRYETEWWGELLHTFSSKDYPFITRYLEIAAEKVPVLLGAFLMQQYERIS